MDTRIINLESNVEEVKEFLNFYCTNRFTPNIQKYHEDHVFLKLLTLIENLFSIVKQLKRSHDDT